MDKIENNKIQNPKRNHKFSKLNREIKKYENFLNNVEKSDFKNAYTRYIAEYKILKLIIETANKEDRKIEAQELSNRLEEVTKILKEEKGITLR